MIKMFKNIKQWWMDRFIKKEFIKVIYDGSYYIERPIVAIDMIAHDDEPTTYKFEKIMMTEQEYKKLPEFNGF